MEYRLFGGLTQMARKQQAEQWAEHRRQCAEEERRQRVMVITEFDAGDLRKNMPNLSPERSSARTPKHPKILLDFLPPPIHDELEYLRAALEDVFLHVTLSTGASLRFAHDARCASV
jgi:hypothetical protein